MIRRLVLQDLARLWCLGCERIIWPWQPRCFDYHRKCKHAEDQRHADLFGIARWSCGACGR